MKSITIHGLDNVLDNLIQKEAKEKGLSLNKTIKNLLRKAFGISKKERPDHRNEFLDLCGTLSKQEAKELLKTTESFRKIDSKDWI